MHCTPDALDLPNARIIVTDDHSTDGTGNAAIETAETMRTSVRVEQYPGPQTRPRRCNGAAFAACAAPGMPLKDPMSGFFAIRRESIRKTVASSPTKSDSLPLTFLFEKKQFPAKISGHPGD